MNAAAAALLGTPADVSVGQTIGALIPALDAVVDSGVRRAVDRDEASAEIGAVEIDGARRWFRVRFEPLRGDDGSPEAVAIVALYITAHKATESTLREQERWIELTLRAAGVGAWDWEIESNTVRWSGEVARLFGIPIEAFGGTFDAYRGLIHPDDVERVMGAVAAHVEAGSADAPYRVDHRVVRPDGEIRSVRGEGTLVVDARGRPTRMRGTVRDVTDLERAAAALRREQGLREAEARLRLEIASMRESAALDTIIASCGRELVAVGVPVSTVRLQPVDGAAVTSRDEPKVTGSLPVEQSTDVAAIRRIGDEASVGGVIGRGFGPHVGRQRRSRRGGRGHRPSDRANGASRNATLRRPRPAEAARRTPRANSEDRGGRSAHGGHRSQLQQPAPDDHRRHWNGPRRCCAGRAGSVEPGPR